MKYKVTKKQNNSNDCIVCGLNTDASLKTAFYELENNTVVGFCTPQNHHQSYPDRMHGGMICAILDEVMGRGLQINNSNAWGVTGSIEIKYKKAQTKITVRILLFVTAWYSCMKVKGA